MPTVTLNRNVVESLIGKKTPIEKLRDRISMLGTDLESISDTEIVVEIFPNRPDMLCEQGFARALSSFLNIKTGLKNYTVQKSGYFCKVEKTLEVWPYTVNAIVKNLKFDDESIREVMQLQEKLGTTLTRHRKKGGIGIYPLDKIKFPIRFTTMKLNEIKFRPLDSSKEMYADEILEKHPAGIKYSNILQNQKEQPVFIDANNQILSIPPIINSYDTGRITQSTKDVFIECSGPDLNILNVALNIIVTSLADMGGKIFSIDVINKNKKITTPDLSPKTMNLDVKYVNKILGLNLKEKEIKKYLMMMGFDYKNKNALVPSYRNDILHQIDLIEEIAIAFGYEHFPTEITSFGSIAEEDQFEKFKRKIQDILVSLSFIQVNAFCLTNEDKINKKMNTNYDTVKLLNSINQEYNAFRYWLLPSSLEVLKNNKSSELPHKIFEIGRTFNSKNELDHLCVVISNSKTNFTELKQILDALFTALGIEYKLDVLTHPSFIEGRTGSIIIKDKAIGFIGEVHPDVILNWDLENPIVALELNVNELFEKL